MHEGVSHTLRFQILLRDRFTCQYCGASAPQARVEVEHIVPPKQGGDRTNPANLICSCRECNRGKGTKQLKDSNLTALTDFDLITAQHEKLIAVTRASLEYEQALQSLALMLDRYWWGISRSNQSTSSPKKSSAYFATFCAASISSR